MASLLAGSAEGGYGQVCFWTFLVILPVACKGGFPFILVRDSTLMVIDVPVKLLCYLDLTGSQRTDLVEVVHQRLLPSSRCFAPGLTIRCIPPMCAIVRRFCCQGCCQRLALLSEALGDLKSLLTCLPYSNVSTTVLYTSTIHAIRSIRICLLPDGMLRAIYGMACDPGRIVAPN